MSKIIILSKQVAELIAAGEVVERPASVVKELMENSIDAGSTSVTIEIKNGGITYIRITDNGSGIDSDDVENAFKSHATSKIESADDLGAIATLGFRGEALASIAAVARVEMLTKSTEQEFGSRYCIEGGDPILFDEAGCPKGTTIIIRDLFFNTPARMKFLKKDVSEANAIAGVVDRIALSHPEVAVRFIRDGKQTLLTPGDGDLKSAIYSVFGKDFADGLIPAEYLLESIRVSGFVSKPMASRPNRSMQFFFLNGRLIKTMTGSTALSEAYKNSIMAGKFPSCVLNIDISPEMVDINVHPAKTEARFVNDKQLFNAVYYCAKTAITTGDTRPSFEAARVVTGEYFQELTKAQQMSFPYAEKSVVYEPAIQSKPKKPNIDIMPDEETLSGTPSSSDKTADTVVEKKTAESVVNYETTQNIHEEKIPNNGLSAEQKEVSAEYAGDNQVNVEINTDNEIETDKILIIGEVFKTYIIVQIDDKILIIDKHAAHERMIYDKLASNNKDKPSQIILTPVTVVLNKEEYSSVLENSNLLEQTGFIIEDFGQGMIIVRECPMMLDLETVGNAILELAGYLFLNKNNLDTEKLDWIYHSIACRAAIKAGDFTTEYERKSFVETLLKTPSIRYCPHGRPVFIEMKRNELEKSFGRS
jgi:DNA mismatch repair protein MutL